MVYYASSIILRSPKGFRYCKDDFRSSVWQGGQSRQTHRVLAFLVHRRHLLQEDGILALSECPHLVRSASNRHSSIRCTAVHAAWFRRRLPRRVKPHGSRRRVDAQLLHPRVSARTMPVDTPSGPRCASGARSIGKRRRLETNALFFRFLGRKYS